MDKRPLPREAKPAGLVKAGAGSKRDEINPIFVQICSRIGKQGQTCGAEPHHRARHSGSAGF